MEHVPCGPCEGLDDKYQVETRDPGRKWAITNEVDSQGNQWRHGDDKERPNKA